MKTNLQKKILTKLRNIDFYSMNRKTTRKWFLEINFINSKKIKGQWCPNCRSYYIEDDEEMCQICGWPYNN